MANKPTYEELEQKIKKLEEDQFEQNRLLKMLKEENCKSQKYFNMAGTMLLVLDYKGKVSLINKKGCDILEFKKSEIIGKNWFDNFIPERMRESVKDIFQRLMNGKMINVEHVEGFKVLTSNGYEKLLSWHNSLLHNSKGNIIGTLSSGEDITERKNVENELMRYQEHLEELVKKRTTKLTDLNEKLKKALDEVKTLRCLLPLCSYCKKIRDDVGYWEDVDVYIHKYLKADITHSICPECIKKHYPNLYE